MFSLYLTLVWIFVGLPSYSALSIDGKKVIYIDYRDVNWSNPGQAIINAIDAGYNVVNLAFYMSTGPEDMAKAWQSVTPLKQQQVLSYAHSKNAVVLISAGGATDAPYSAMSGTKYGALVGNWALQNNMDGVDFDMENFRSGLTFGTVNIIQWLSDCTVAAKQIMNSSGKSLSIITHAPQAPFFGKIGSSSGNSWTGTKGGYSAVYSSVGHLIDWFNIQFYNQGSFCYVTYNSLFVSSSDNGKCAFRGTSITEISAYGIPLDKLVVGKFTKPNDAGDGFVNANSLGAYFLQAYNSFGWKAGVMFWAWSASSSRLTLISVWTFPAKPFTLVPTSTRPADVKSTIRVSTSKLTTELPPNITSTPRQADECRAFCFGRDVGFPQLGNNGLCMRYFTTVECESFVSPPGKLGNGSPTSRECLVRGGGSLTLGCQYPLSCCTKQQVFGSSAELDSDISTDKIESSNETFNFNLLFVGFLVAIIAASVFWYIYVKIRSNFTEARNTLDEISI